MPERKRPRKLENLHVDEVSLVDKPANEIEFLLLKRKADMEDDILTEEEEEVDVDKDLVDAPLRELCSVAAEAVGDLADHFQKRMEEVSPKRRERRMMKGLPITIFDLVKEGESGDVQRFFDALEKMVGPYPTPYGKKPYPYGGPYTKSEAYRMPYNPGKLRKAIEDALSIKDLPVDVKKALEEVVKAMAERGVSKEDEPISRGEFEKFASSTATAITNLADILKAKKKPVDEGEEEEEKDEHPKKDEGEDEKGKKPGKDKEE